MSTTIDTFIYLKRDIEQSFQRVQKLSNSSHYDQQELDQLFNHISCTLDDLEKINQLLHSSNTSYPLNLSDDENDFEDTTKLISQKRNKDQKEKYSIVSYSKEHDESFLSSSNSNLTHPNSSDQREEFVRHMKIELDYYKNKVQSTKKDAPMEIIRLDQAPEEEETEDKIICKQDAQLNDFHLSIVSLKNLTQNMNLEINDHIRVLDNLETNMINSQNRVGNLTNRTKNFLRTSAGGIGGHTCLFCIAVGLFFFDCYSHSFLLILLKFY